MPDNNNIYRAVFSGAAAVLAVFIIMMLWQVGSRSSEGSVRLAQDSMGFSLAVPSSWQGRYYVQETQSGRKLEFYFRPEQGRPEYMFEVALVPEQDWPAESRRDPERLRELGRRDGGVYCARWATGNPYQGGVARQYFRMMQSVPKALDTFAVITLARSGVKPGEQVACRDIPLFSDYPGEPKYAGAPSPVDLMSAPGAREFRAQLAAAQAQGPNFAGRYAFASWGCGTNCQQHAVIDVGSGRIAAWGLGSQYGADYELESRLLVLDPPERLAESRAPAAEAAAAVYYELTDAGELKAICRLEAPEIPGPNQDGGPCVQVITRARDTLTGEERDFPTPCDVPEGWERVLPEPL